MVSHWLIEGMERKMKGSSRRRRRKAMASDVDGRES
jgi:hypothetical protein